MTICKICGLPFDIYDKLQEFFLVKYCSNKSLQAIYIYRYIYIYIYMYVVKFDTKATELFRKMALFEFMTNFVKRENSRLITS